MRFPRIKKIFAGVALLLLAGSTLIGLTACSQSAQASSCAFVVGDGQGRNDAKLHKIIYPGSTVDTGTGEVTWYVPCNSRNYIINNGSQKDVTGKSLIGDRHQPIQATTNTGVPVLISARALWTLNESKDALTNFWPVCLKYSCATTADKAGDSNYASPGWNGMLAENFSPAMDVVGREAASQVDDSIWQKHSPDAYKALGDAMSKDFADAIRANLGYSQDLFCGSGNSGWQNPSKPGVGTFTCTPVRIVVDDVERAPVTADSSQGAAVVNQQRLANAKILYGDAAAYWLGVMDAIDECHKSGTTCYIYLGNAPGAPTPPGTSK